MNYYERYCGDYQRDTAHLSLAEHGAYTMLLDTYFSVEKPLPAELPGLYRVCRAMTRIEQQAVRAVAEQFFPVSGIDGLRHNPRADREIVKARPKIEAARINGKKGGRPPKDGIRKGAGQGTPQKPDWLYAGSERAMTQVNPEVTAKVTSVVTPEATPEANQKETRREPVGEAHQHQHQHQHQDYKKIDAGNTQTIHSPQPPRLPHSPHFPHFPHKQAAEEQAHPLVHKQAPEEQAYPPVHKQPPEALVHSSGHRPAHLPAEQALGDVHTPEPPKPAQVAGFNPVAETPEESRAAAPVLPGVAGACCKSMIRHGVQGCNPHHPTLRALLEAGAVEEEFVEAARSAVARGKASFAYVIGTVKRQREEAAKLVLHRGRMPNRQELLEASNKAATEGWLPPELRAVESAAPESRERQHANG